MILYSTTWAHHLEQIKELFTRLAAAKLTVNLSKCEFGKARVTYLGKIVGGGQVRPLQPRSKPYVIFLFRVHAGNFGGFLGWQVTTELFVKILHL